MILAINNMFLDLSIGELLATPGSFLRQPSCGKYNNNCNVKDIVMDRIELLESVNQNSSNWRLVVEEVDKENTCSSNDIFMIR